MKFFEKRFKLKKLTAGVENGNKKFIYKLHTPLGERILLQPEELDHAAELIKKHGVKFMRGMMQT